MDDREGEAEVFVRLGKPSMGYTEFFPAGLSEYHNATVGNAQTLAGRLQASVDANSGTTGMDFTSTATDLITAFETARAAQMDYKGAATDTRGNRDEK